MKHLSSKPSELPESSPPRSEMTVATLPWQQMMSSLRGSQPLCIVLASTLLLRHQAWLLVQNRHSPPLSILVEAPVSSCPADVDSATADRPCWRCASGAIILGCHRCNCKDSNRFDATCLMSWGQLGPNRPKKLFSEF